MAESAVRNEFQETWDRLLLLLISRPIEGWEFEFEEITQREVERLAVSPDEQGCDE